MTITLQIGNTDNKLTQQEWASFFLETEKAIRARASVELHFSGAPPATSQWQNACFVFASESPIALSTLRSDIKILREKYRQDSVAWTEGETQFL